MTTKLRNQVSQRKASGFVSVHVYLFSWWPLGISATPTNVTEVHNAWRAFTTRVNS